MLLELIRFVGAAILLIVPGLLTAGALGLGETILQRICYGSAVGFGGVIWLAAMVGHFTLEAFFPLWAVWGVAAGIAWQRSIALPARLRVADESWMWLVLLAVGVSRFAIALPQDLPRGWDPTFHLILIKKIWLTQRAIVDWRPFVPAELNYPTGCHLLVVLLAEISRLPLHTTFKDLEPLLGVVTTAQIYLLASAATGRTTAGIYAAAIYGMLTWSGSISYYAWGGAPNELAMMLFIAMLALWLDNRVQRRSAIGVMALLYAAVIFSHHHVMLASAAVLTTALAWAYFFPHTDGRGAAKRLLISLLIAGAMDSIYLVGYAAKITTLPTTGIVGSGEPPLPISNALTNFDWVVGLLALAGVTLWITRRLKCHAVIGLSSVAILLLYVLCEYVSPILLAHRGLPAVPIFTPSRFLADLNYFVAVFAGAAVACLAGRYRVRTGFVTTLLLAGSIAEAGAWADLASSRRLPPPGYIAGLRWINGHTTPQTIVINHDVAMDAQSWAPYVTWRRCTYIPLPVSEPADKLSATEALANDIVLHNVHPDAPDLQIVQILPFDIPDGATVLWSDPRGYAVIRLWPLRQLGRADRGGPDSIDRCGDGW